MAGGRGERFWPKSRMSLPKQFLSLTDDGKTMLQLTVERIRSLVALEDVYIATNELYRNLVLEQLPGLPETNILCEPVARNTAPCIGLGAVHIASKYEDAVMMVLPSDHLIKNNEVFLQTLTDASEVAQQGKNLVTLGITPNYPETGYGYIKYDSAKFLMKAYKVERFVEKPDYDTAKKYLDDGRYLWNSGMFIWKVSSILYNLCAYMPATYQKLKEIEIAIGTEKQEEKLQALFPECESTSIDYGVLEKAGDIYTLPGSFGWDDVGSWLAVERIRAVDEDNNVLNGNIIAVDTKNSTIEGTEKLIAAVGLKDIIVVDTKDATLICDKKHVGKIKEVIGILKEQNNKKYL